jgi:hypothetical protein
MGPWCDGADAAAHISRDRGPAPTRTNLNSGSASRSIRGIQARQRHRLGLISRGLRAGQEESDFTWTRTQCPGSRSAAGLRRWGGGPAPIPRLCRPEPAEARNRADFTLFCPARPASASKVPPRVSCPCKTPTNADCPTRPQGHIVLYHICQCIVCIVRPQGHIVPWPVYPDASYTVDPKVN